MKGFLKFRKTGDLKYIYKNKLDKAYFSYDATYSDGGKGLAKRTAWDKILKGRAYALNCKKSWKWWVSKRISEYGVHVFWQENRIGGKCKWRASTRITQTSDKKNQKRKVYARFKDNIWGADFAELGSLSSFNCGVKYLLCVIDVSNKYTRVKPLKNKNAKTFLLGSTEIVIIHGWSKKRILK